MQQVSRSRHFAFDRIGFFSPSAGDLQASVGEVVLFLDMAAAIRPGLSCCWRHRIQDVAGRLEREGIASQLALRMAWFTRYPGKQAGLIFHSDRSSQYASHDFRTLLAE